MADLPEVRLVQLGCLTCRALETAVRERSLDVAYYMGVVIGANAVQPSGFVALCERCAERWRIIEPGLRSIIELGSASSREPLEGDDVTPLRDLPDGSWLWWDVAKKTWQPETTDAHRVRRLTRERDALATRLENAGVRVQRGESRRAALRDVASRIVTRVVADLNDRRGLHLDGIAEDVLLGILEQWKGIAVEEMTRG